LPNNGNGRFLPTVAVARQRFVTRRQRLVAKGAHEFNEIPTKSTSDTAEVCSEADKDLYLGGDV
jgi:hypothetical protein